VILRVLNLVVIGILVLAAAYVYRIKFDATVQAERLARLRGELRHERDKIAALRAEWEQLDSPARIETLAKRHLSLRPIAPTQFDTLDRLPERPTQDLATGADPIGGIIENLEQPNRVEVTGTLPAAADPSRATAERSTGGIATGASPNERSR
jgi:cell division protein FtsL